MGVGELNNSTEMKNNHEGKFGICNSKLTRNVIKGSTITLIIFFITLVMPFPCYADSFSLVSMYPAENSMINTGSQTFTATVSYNLSSDGHIVISDNANNNVRSLASGSGNTTISLTTLIPDSWGGRNYRINLTLTNSQATPVYSMDVIYTVRESSTGGSVTLYRMIPNPHQPLTISRL